MRHAARPLSTQARFADCSAHFYGLQVFAYDCTFRTCERLTAHLTLWSSLLFYTGARAAHGTAVQGVQSVRTAAKPAEDAADAGLVGREQAQGRCRGKHAG